MNKFLKYGMVLATVFFSCQLSAQEGKLSDIFRQMPDSLMPYLTGNNRLDFIDFLDSNMKAEVRNSLGGQSEMTSLADDSLTIRMNESLHCDLLLLTLAEPIDSVTDVVVIVETFMVDSIYGESTVKYFTTSWQPLQQMPPLSEAQQKRIQRHILQNIVKRKEELLKER